MLTETEIQQKIAKLISQRDENKSRIFEKRAALKQAIRPDAIEQIQQIADLISATAAYAQITAMQAGVVGRLSGFYQSLGYEDAEIFEIATGPGFTGLEPGDA